ncbi:MAG: PTS sugar transporter subunit IIC [Elusimicrobia bacterium]|nr:PTS sugar transporter subunit IIC [Elusimicrobiota bacterium]
MDQAPELWLAALGVSLVELDASHLSLFFFSRPIVAGPFFGWTLGNAALGAALGVLCELLNLGELPVGGHLPLNATVAAGAALLLALGEEALPVELALPMGFLAGWGHCRLETSLRRRRSVLGRWVESRLRVGDAPSLGALAAKELAKKFFLTFSVLLGVLAFRFLAPWLWQWTPPAAKEGLRLALLLSPSLALAVVFHGVRSKWA